MRRISRGGGKSQAFRILACLIFSGLATISFSGLVLAHGNGLPDTYIHLAKGCTTAYYIDEDCDGYGIGEGYVTGPDADDTDPDVNTTPSAIAKYGTMEAFIKAKYQSLTGLPNGGILNFFVIDADGSASPQKSPSLSTALANPYNVSSVSLSTARAGDCIIIRSGTYTNGFYWNGYYGTDSNPIYFITYPGEHVTFDRAGVVWTTHRSYANRGKNIIIDGMGGMYIDNTNYPSYKNSLIADTFFAENITIRELEATRSYSTKWTAREGSNLKAEKLVLHGGPSGSHQFYFTANPASMSEGNTGISSNLTVRSCIFYGQDGDNYPIIQSNGGIDGFLMEGNIFVTDDTVFSCQGKGENIIVRNNVFIGSGIFLTFYFDHPAGFYYVKPHEVKNLVVTHNSVYRGIYKANGALNGNNPPIIKFVHSNYSGFTGYGGASIPSWAPNTSYAQNAFAKPTAGVTDCYYVKKTSGTQNSGDNEPAWGHIPVGITNDNGIEWLATCRGITENNVIRNNIFMMQGSDSDYVFSFGGEYASDPLGRLKYPTITNNIVYRATNQGRVLYVEGPVYDFAGFETYASHQAHFSGNTNQDPQYTAYSPSWYGTPGLYNLMPLSASPAKGMGIAGSGNPTTDIKGVVRFSNDAGAYEIISLVPDYEAPSVPTNLIATAVSSSQISLSWAASTDNVAVAGYRIYRNGSFLSTSVSTAYQDNGLSPSTTYSYRVSAYDTVGNESGQSAPASSTTPASVSGRTTLQTGTGSNKISLIFFPSGFTEAQSADFISKVSGNLAKLWANNLFAAYQQRFDVYRVDNQYDSGVSKTNAQIEAIIDQDLTCGGKGFGDSPTTPCVHIFIDSNASRSETDINFIRLKNDTDSYYTAAHETGVHMLGNLGRYDSQSSGPRTKDGYACSSYTYSYLSTNIHDRNSADKWSDLTGTVALCGGGFYSPSLSTTEYASTYKDFSNVAYKAAQIGLAKRTQDSFAYAALGTDFTGTRQYGQDSTKPSVTVSGIQSDSSYSSHINIGVTASDASGIDRVEFYVGVDGAEYRSFGVIHAPPYSQQLDLSTYNGTSYSVRIYTFDEAWNYVRSQYDNLSFSVGSPAPSACQASLVLLHHYDSNLSDSSGNGNTGTLMNGPVFTTGKFGNALAFDGVDDYVNVSKKTGLYFGTSDFSVSLWLKTLNSTAVVISDVNTYSSANRGWVFRLATGKPQIWMTDGSGAAVSITAAATINNGNWRHVAVVFDREANATIYIDGSLDKSNSITNEAGTMDQCSYLTIGAGRNSGTASCGGAGTSPLNGAIDELAIWNRALSASEIQTIYSSGPVSCFHKSDTSQNGCVDETELMTFIGRWKADSSDPTLKELMEAIGMWKRGC